MILLTFLLSLSAIASINDQIKTFVLEQNAVTLDQVVKKLPEDLRSNFTLVRKGRALIEGTGTYPGAILFGQDARVLIAFNGSPKQAGYASLDVLEFDEKNQHYVPTRFLFSPTPAELKMAKSAYQLGTSNVYFEPTPGLCKNCHGISHHPIFETGYPTWEGFYGSERDHLYGSDKKDEIADFKKFRDVRKRNPRYSALIFPSENFSSMTPFLDSETEHQLSYGAAHAYRPNLMFGTLLMRRNAKTIMQVMKSSPYYAEFSRLLVASLEKCDLSKLNLVEIGNKLKTLSTVPEISELYLNSTSFLNNESITNRKLAAQILSVLGVSRDHWNLSLMTKQPLYDYGYWSGYGDIYEIVHSEIVKDLKLESLYSVKSLGLSMDTAALEIEGRLSSLGTILESKNSETSCRQLTSSR